MSINFSRDGRRTVVMSSQDYESARRGAKAPQQSEGGKDRRKSVHGDISYRATDGRRYLSRWDRREGGDVEYYRNSEGHAAPDRGEKRRASPPVDDTRPEHPYKRRSHDKDWMSSRRSDGGGSYIERRNDSRRSEGRGGGGRGDVDKRTVYPYSQFEAPPPLPTRFDYPPPPLPGPRDGSPGAISVAESSATVDASEQAADDARKSSACSSTSLTITANLEQPQDVRNLKPQQAIIRVKESFNLKESFAEESCDSKDDIFDIRGLSVTRGTSPIRQPAVSLHEACQVVHDALVSTGNKKMAVSLKSCLESEGGQKMSHIRATNAFVLDNIKKQAKSRPQLKETYKQLKAILDRDDRVLEDNSDLVSVAINYRQTAPITNANVMCFLSTIKKSKKKKPIQLAAELSDHELLQQLRGRGLTDDRIKAIENVLTTSPMSVATGFPLTTTKGVGVERPSPPPPPQRQPKQQPTKPKQTTLTEKKTAAPPVVMQQPSKPLVTNNSAAVANGSGGALTAAIQAVAAAAAPHPAPSVSPAAIHQSNQKCSNWLSQKTKPNAPRHYEDMEVVDLEDGGPDEDLDLDDIGIDDSISNVLNRANVRDLSRRVSIRSAYGAVERDVKDATAGASDVNRAVKYILGKNIQVPVTEELFKNIYHARSTRLNRSELLNSCEMTPEELAVARDNWDMLLRAVGINNQFDFCIDILAILPTEARVSKKKNVIGCFLGQGLREPRHSLTVLEYTLEHVTDPVKVTGNFSPEEKIVMTRMMEREGSSWENATTLAKKFKRTQIRSIHCWFQANRTTQSLQQHTQHQRSPATVSKPPSNRFIPDEQKRLILKVFELNRGADIYTLTSNKLLTSSTIETLAPKMKRPSHTIKTHWNQILVPTILAHLHNRLHILPETGLLKAVIDKGVKGAIDYVSLVKDMPWHTPDSAKYIVELCLAKAGNNTAPTHEKAYEVMHAHYLSKTMSQTVSERRWVIAEAYEEAMKKYNPQ